MNPQRIAGAFDTVEPLTLAEAKDHLRIKDNTADDTWITNAIKRARKRLEVVTGRQLITATWKLWLDAFPAEIVLPYPPLQSVETVAYTDSAGDPQTLAASGYQYDIYTEPGRMKVAYNESWPTTYGVYNAVSVEYKAGYGDAASDVPEDLLQWMRLMVAHWMEHRSPTGEALISGELRHTLADIERAYTLPKV